MFTRKRNREKWRIITKRQNKRYIWLKKTYRLWKRAWRHEKGTGRHEKGTGRHLKKGGLFALWKGPSWNTEEAYFLKTKSNNNLCILRTKCSPSQIQCINIAPKKMMVWQKKLIVLALQRMKVMHVFFLFSISVLCNANSRPLDNNRGNCNQSWLKCS